ncbi:alpha/beta hydrolase [Kribbella sp. NBC_00709]|uniref:alpha/beta fold hydrolase n=1 Tax=Kribbella sp. NBC_00709 TaxID=2975972 RepID=UPI002E290318|nr:alpha/beta hydrolase [Kribbella sp. NBC_00709]
MSENDLQQSHGVHVVHTGSRQAAPVLLIHGSGASGACWAPMIPALARGHHVVTIDLPGLGHSAPVTSYDIPAQAARVAAMIDALDVGPLVVVGHSSGGYVATSLAEQRPELVKAMALISTGPRLEALLPQRPLIRALSGPPLGRLIWALRSDKLIRKGINATCARQVDIPVELVADLRGLPYRDFVDVLRCNGEYITECSVPERLAKLDVPLLVVFGTADPRWDPASAQEYAVVPGVRIEMLPGIGHIAPLEAPEETAKLVLEFAERA